MRTKLGQEVLNHRVGGSSHVAFVDDEMSRSTASMAHNKARLCRAAGNKMARIELALAVIFVGRGVVVDLGVGFAISERGYTMRAGR